MGRGLVTLTLMASVLGCVHGTAEEQVMSKVRWSQSEIRNYRALCRASQPAGVLPETAGFYCDCKTLALSISYDSMDAARSAEPTDRDRLIYAQTGQFPRGEIIMPLAKTMSLCSDMTRDKFGIPEVALRQ